ncbi:MAG: hypothetical protein CL434_09020 [Acidimicrobiaceae bacterium]|nr:hypothetical protein [Acidimicrobiaceae bacterium]
MESPSGDFNSTSLDDRGFACWWKPYDIRSATIRIGDKPLCGYRWEDLVDAWDRWRPSFTRGKWNIQNSYKASSRSPNYHHARDASKRFCRPEFGGPRLDHQRFAVTGLPDT